MKAVIVADGGHAPADSGLLADAELIIAADGGTEWLDEQGIAPHLVVGDLDSANPALIDRLASARVSIERHPVDKEASDLELGVAAARKVGADDIVVLGALGGALDHLLANVLLLGSTALAGRSIRLVHGSTSARVLTGPADAELDAPAGARVSLLAVGPAAEGVTTRGLRWRLAADRLEPGSSRGLANVVETVPAGVSLVAGRLLIVEVAGDGKENMP